MKALIHPSGGPVQEAARLGLFLHKLLTMHRLAARLALTLLASMTFQGHAATPPVGEVTAASAQLSRALAGTWDEGSESESFCQTGRNLRRITPSSDGRRITWDLDQPIDFLDGAKVISYSYSVVRSSGVSVTLSLDGETRKNPRGEPFLWELVVVAPGKLRWRSTHFDFGVYNNVWLVRCKP